MRFTNAAGWYGAAAACLLVPTFLTQACDGRIELETRTFELQYLNPAEAAEMVTPYVYPDRTEGPGAVTHFESGITVRETPEALARIADVVERYDIPKPGVRLHFQLIEANGYTETDERIAEVQAALEELFRFDGYRLLAEGQMAMMAGTSSEQVLAAAGDRSFSLQSMVREVRGGPTTGSAAVTVFLAPDQCCHGQVNTSLVVPVGETVVLGSSQSPGQGTLILTVRPEFVVLPSR